MLLNMINCKKSLFTKIIKDYKYIDELRKEKNDNVKLSIIIINF